MVVYCPQNVTSAYHFTEKYVLLKKNALFLLKLLCN